MTARDNNLPMADGAAPRETAAPCRPEAPDRDYLLRTPEDRGWEEFRDQCRRQMRRSLDQRIQYGFCRVHKPVLDDSDWRIFDTMKDYRDWCAANLPDYLGFKPAVK